MVCEIEGSERPVEVPGGGGDLIAFMSFAVSRGFGATHPLIALADRLHQVHRVPMGPLTTFYDLHEEDGEDREKRELSWLPAAELASALRALAAAAASDPQCVALTARAGATELPSQAAALACALESAAPGARARVGYEL